jgi:hypothetical protein
MLLILLLLLTNDNSTRNKMQTTAYSRRLENAKM